MKRRKYSVFVYCRPADSGTNLRSFRTLKIARRYIFRLMSEGKEVVAIERWTRKGYFTIEQTWYNWDYDNDCDLP